MGGLIDKLKSLAQAKVPKGLPKDEAQAYFEEALKGLLASPPPELAPGQGVPLAAGEYAKPGDIIHPGSLDDVKPGGVTVFAYDPGYGGPGQDPPPKLGFGASLSGVEKKAVADSVGEHLAKLQAANAMIGNPALLGPGGPKKLIGPEIKNLDWLTGIPSSALPIDPKTPMSEIATISDGVPPDFDHDAAAALFGQLKAAGQGAKAAPKSGLGLVAPVHSQQSLLKVATVAEISMVGGDGPATLKVTGFNQHGQPMTEYLKLTAGGQFKPIYDAQALSYKKSYAPLHFSGDLMEEAKASGALDKQVAAELKALQQEHAKAMADHVYGALISKIDTTPGKESITMSAAPGDVAYKSKPAAPAKPNPKVKVTYLGPLNYEKANGLAFWLKKSDPPWIFERSDGLPDDRSAQFGDEQPYWGVDCEQASIKLLEKAAKAALSFWPGGFTGYRKHVIRLAGPVFDTFRESLKIGKTPGEAAWVPKGEYLYRLIRVEDSHGGAVALT